MLLRKKESGNGGREKWHKVHDKGDRDAVRPRRDTLGQFGLREVVRRQGRRKEGSQRQGGRTETESGNEVDSTG